MSGESDARARSQAMWREVMQAGAPPITDPYTEVTMDHLMGNVWTRPGLARRDRRLVTLTAAAVAGHRDSLRNHLRASVESGDLSRAELDEWVVHLAHYGGWPTATTAYAVLGEVAPKPGGSLGEPTSTLPTGRFVCDFLLRRIRPPQFVREERDGVTYLTARDYETAYDTTLSFDSGAQLRVSAKVVGELNQRVVVRDARGRPSRMSGFVQGRVEISGADGHVIFRGRYYDSRAVQALAGDEAFTGAGPVTVDHFENGIGEGPYAGHVLSLGVRATREGDSPLRGEARGEID
jgi:alkylhydroperoxidase/carboxymuconolactone decarboxylase family protein YurZ